MSCTRYLFSFQVTDEEMKSKRKEENKEVRSIVKQILGVVTTHSGAASSKKRWYVLGALFVQVIKGLYSLIKGGMIQARLGQYIIPRYKTPVQHKSVISYLTEVVKSYITLQRKDTKSYLGNTFPFLVLLLIGMATQSKLSSISKDQTEGSEASQAKIKGNSTKSKSDDKKRCAIYARVSTNEQAEEGASIDAQIGNLKDLIEQTEDLKLTKTIKDEGKSGTNFNRSGFEEIQELAAKDEIDRLLVTELDRIGRNVIKTLREIEELREKGVIITTPDKSIIDIKDPSQRVPVVIETLMADMQNRRRTDKIMRSKIELFKDGNWKSWYKKIPMGYKEREDGWLKVNNEEKEMVQDIYKTFIKNKKYKRTLEEINARHDFSEDISYQQLINILHNPVYIGKPTIDSEYVEEIENEKEIVKEDEDLKIIDEEVYEEVQKKTQDIYKKSANDPEGATVEEISWEYGAGYTYHISQYVGIICPDCREVMRKNGQRELTERLDKIDQETCHLYQCTECGRQKKFPTEKDIRKLDSKPDSNQ